MGRSPLPAAPVRLPAARVSLPSRSRCRRTASTRPRSTGSGTADQCRPDEPAATQGPSAHRACGTRDASGSRPLGRPLLGQRELAVGAVGWDVSSLEFRLVPFGLSPKAVDGRFTAATANALARFQAKRHLAADGIAGKLTFRALAGGSAAAAAFKPPVRATHVVAAGESFYSIAERYGVSPLLLAKEGGLTLSTVIVPGQRLTLPAGAGSRAPRAALPGSVPDRRRRMRSAHPSTTGRRPTASIRNSPARLRGWSRASRRAWSRTSVPLGVMQLLPGTWEWVDQFLLGVTTPRTYDGNVRAGVRYLRWLLDQFDGDRRLALAGLLPGCPGGARSRPVRRHGAVRRDHPEAPRHRVDRPRAAAAWWERSSSNGIRRNGLRRRGLRRNGLHRNGLRRPRSGQEGSAQDGRHPERPRGSGLDRNGLHKNA